MKKLIVDMKPVAEALASYGDMTERLVRAFMAEPVEIIYPKRRIMAFRILETEGGIKRIVPVLE